MVTHLTQPAVEYKKNRTIKPLNTKYLIFIFTPNFLFLSSELKAFQNGLQLP